jgi:hypothetical protein
LPANKTIEDLSVTGDLHLSFCGLIEQHRWFAKESLWLICACGEDPFLFFPFGSVCMIIMCGERDARTRVLISIQRHAESILWWVSNDMDRAQIAFSNDMHVLPGTLLQIVQPGSVENLIL